MVGKGWVDSRETRYSGGRERFAQDNCCTARYFRVEHCTAIHAIGVLIARVIVAFADDFSSDEDDGADEENVDGPRCKALYHYSAKLNDELSLEPGKSNDTILTTNDGRLKYVIYRTPFHMLYLGDVIHVHSKKSDGWWLGELKGVTGVFPATYVVEID
jgi:hypothetical protein